jgi:hypothetical protein
MPAETLIERAALYLGKQEILGSNDGPNIRRWKSEMGAGVASAGPIPWCGIFVFNMLMERNGIDRRHLVAALGFRPGSFYPESCDSWLEETKALAQRGMPPVPGQPIPALAPVTLVTEPRACDLLLLAVPVLGGGYQPNKVHHIGFCTSSILTDPGAGSVLSTIEGNTVPGGVEGPASREGDGVYRRTRTVAPGKLLFLRLPAALTGFQEVLS